MQGTNLKQGKKGMMHCVNFFFFRVPGNKPQSDLIEADHSSYSSGFSRPLAEDKEKRLQKNKPDSNLLHETLRHFCRQIYRF